MSIRVIALFLVASTCVFAGIVRRDHTIPNRSKVPGFEGKDFSLFVREAYPAVVTPNVARRAVLFIHGEALPGVPSFDVEGQSWLDYMAKRGLHSFLMDLSGYGNSTRPAPMDNPQNLDGTGKSKAHLRGGRAGYQLKLTSLESEVADINTAVNFIRKSLRITRVGLVGWGMGGERALAYAERYPAKVRNIVVFGTGLKKSGTGYPTAKPKPFPVKGYPFQFFVGADLWNDWKSMRAREDQVAAGVPEAILRQLLAGDALGARWGKGCIRVPTRECWGYNVATIKAVKAPVLVAIASHDKKVETSDAERLYDTVGAERKVGMLFMENSHYMPWENGNRRLYKAAFEWIERAQVDGDHSSGVAIVDTSGAHTWRLKFDSVTKTRGTGTRFESKDQNEVKRQADRLFGYIKRKNMKACLKMVDPNYIEGHGNDNAARQFESIGVYVHHRSLNSRDFRVDRVEMWEGKDEAKVHSSRKIGKAWVGNGFSHWIRVDGKWYITFE